MNKRKVEGWQKQAYFSLLIFLSFFVVFCGYRLADCLIIDCAGAKRLAEAYYFQGTSFLFFLPLTCLFVYLWGPQLFFSLLLFSIFCINLLGTIYFFQTDLSSLSPRILTLFRAYFYLLCIYIPSSFWSFIDRYYELKEAENLFGIFQGMALLGMGSVALLLKYALVPLRIPGVLSLLTLCSLFLIFLTSQIHSHCSTCSHLVPQNFTKGEKKQFNLLFFFSFFPIVIFLEAISNRLLETLVEAKSMLSLECFLLSDISNSSTKLNEEQLLMTPFLSKISLYVSLGNILFSIFGYRILVRRWGLRFLLFIPSLFYLSFFSLCNQQCPPLCTGLFGFFITEGVLFCLEDNNFNLLMKHLPVHIKSSFRIFIESLSEGFGILLGYLSIKKFSLLENSSSRISLSFFLFGITAIIYLYARSWKKREFLFSQS